LRGTRASVELREEIAVNQRYERAAISGDGMNSRAIAKTQCGEPSARFEGVRWRMKPVA
jgi:hypothetical protein